MIDDLTAIERAAEMAEMVGDDALMARAIRALGEELAKRDPVTWSMLSLDADLQLLAISQLAPAGEYAHLHALIDEVKP